MIQIDMPIPKCCDECFALDDHGDYPFCLISQDQRGYTFNARENRMPSCPLKSREHRVMTLEEVKSLEHDAVVWYEHNGVNKQRPRIVDQVYDSGIIFTDGGHWRFNADAYGKKFRLWTSRPTDAEREATPWN